jgi:hypothetical protein
MKYDTNLIEEAKGWMLDCGADRIYVRDLPHEQVYRIIQKHYEGGWSQFVSDGVPL